MPNYYATNIIYKKYKNIKYNVQFTDEMRCDNVEMEYLCF